MIEPMDEVDRQDDDFLAFWDEHKAKQHVETKRILGVVVPVPNEVPLAFDAISEDLKDSQDIEDIKRVLGLLFSREIIDHWVANGITDKMLSVLLAWGMSNATGKEVDFAEAAELVAEAERAKAAGEGKAPAATNRAARRASSKTVASERTGRSSKRTLPANTGSPPKN